MESSRKATLVFCTTDCKTHHAPPHCRFASTLASGSSLHCWCKIHIETHLQTIIYNRGLPSRGQNSACIREFSDTNHAERRLGLAPDNTHVYVGLRQTWSQPFLLNIVVASDEESLCIANRDISANNFALSW